MVLLGSVERRYQETLTLAETRLCFALVIVRKILVKSDWLSVSLRKLICRDKKLVSAVSSGLKCGTEQIFETDTMNALNKV
jgi:hypothetical protein